MPTTDDAQRAAQDAYREAKAAAAAASQAADHVNGTAYTLPPDTGFADAALAIHKQLNDLNRRLKTASKEDPKVTTTKTSSDGAKPTTTRKKILDNLATILGRTTGTFLAAIAIGAGLQVGKRLAGGGRK